MARTFLQTRYCFIDLAHALIRSQLGVGLSLGLHSGEAVGETDLSTQAQLEENRTYLGSSPSFISTDFILVDTLVCDAF